MRILLAISAVKTGLAILLVAAFSLSLTTTEVHLTVPVATASEKVIVAADETELVQAVQVKGNSGASGGAEKATHHASDCHVHILGINMISLTKDEPSGGRLRSWSENPVDLDLLHGFYRPPRA